MGSYKEEASSLGGWEGHGTNNEGGKKKVWLDPSESY